MKYVVVVGMVLVLITLTAGLYYVIISSGEGDVEETDELMIQTGDLLNIPEDALRFDDDNKKGYIMLPCEYFGSETINKWRCYIENHDVTYAPNNVNVNPNDVFDAQIDLTGVNSGDKQLKIKVFDASNNVVAQDSITLVIPDTWKFYLNTEEYPDDCYRVCRNCDDWYDWWFGFAPPMSGVITRVQGEIMVDLLGNPSCDVWFDIKDDCTGEWHDAIYVIDETNIHTGWVQFDTVVSEEIISKWIGFAGCHYNEDYSMAYNTVTDFRGYIYMKPGYGECGVNPLNFLFSLNPFKDTTPSGSSCNC